jgi:Fe-S-cluster containining protein
LQDAEREPQIAERAKPIYTAAKLTRSGLRELEGYLLNGDDLACMFLDQATNLCTIYDTRPLACRLFEINCSIPSPAQSTWGFCPDTANENHAEKPQISIEDPGPIPRLEGD